MVEAAYKFPIAPVQSALFFLNQIHPESQAYNIPVCVRLEGELDYEALTGAIRVLIERHEIFRTTYDFYKDDIIQIVTSENNCSVEIDTVEIETSEADEEKALLLWVEKKKQKKFDLKGGPLLYIDVGRLSKYDHCLLITFHHITVDHTAIGLFVQQFEYAYRRLSQKMELDLPEQELQFADYVMWLRENTELSELQPKINVWKSRLGGFSGLLNLPLDKPRPPIGTSSGAQFLFELDTRQSKELKEFSSRKSISLYLCLLCMFKVLLKKTCDQDDIIVATPFANRGNQEELDNVMGCFINTLPLATNFKHISDFNSLISTVKAVMLEAYENQTVPFEAIVDAVDPKRDHSYNPLFQVGFVFQTPPVEVMLAGLKCTTIPVHSGGSMYDLHFWMWEKDDRIGGLVWYNTDVFVENSVSDLVENLKKVIERLMVSDSINVSDLNL